METVRSADGTAIAYDQAGRGPLLIVWTASPPFMAQTARTLSRAFPHAGLRALDGQDHNVDPAVLAPVLIAFLPA
jgi:hypothetical protein